MDVENMSITMEPDLLDCGIMIESMVKVPVSTPMEISKTAETGLDQRLINERLCRYQGEWSNGRINGKGTIYLANGDRYSGDWKDGRRHGIGTYFYK